ncbi:glycosyltransferase family 1 protein [Saccharibacillus sp. JS10]|uniref:glycosyltransferase family 4 protein n=1 Tax=Saccharibacillus sp. JS10 TaxID=2950552 RepID=UPI00210A3F77|nr:glycosyltransferase family 1 protein [Saccharibacillus sp. JS10]MCQ4088808.1 glycosyltransferase family 4 protein [Saccharibacillus sp. JS10]
MKKIGIFLHCFPGFGGIFQYAQTVLQALSDLPSDRYQIVAAYTYKEWLTYLEDTEVQAIECPLVHWGQELGREWRKKGLSYTLWKEVTGEIHPIGKILKEQQCDLWIFPSQDSYSFQVDVPALTTVHDLMHRYESRFPEVSDNGEASYRDWVYQNIVEHTKGVLVDSEVGKQQLIETYGVKEDCAFVQPYIPPNYIYNSPPKMRLSPAVSESLPERYLFYPAQFWEHKNHASIVEAVRLLNEKHIRVNFVFVGSHTGTARSETYTKLIEQIEAYGLQNQFVFLGYVKDEEMPLLYKKSSGLVMPTFFGPTNIPPLEAFVLQCPVAISGIYGMPEQLGDAALFFDPNSVEEIADRIQTLWTNTKVSEELVQKGSRRSSDWGKTQFGENLMQIIEVLT